MLKTYLIPPAPWQEHSTATELYTHTYINVVNVKKQLNELQIIHFVRTI